MQENKDLSLSVIVPCFNEEESLPHFLQVVIPVLEEMGRPYELLLIDDGSKDNTSNIIVMETQRNAHVRGIVLSRNFGKEAALTAGLDEATGDAVIMMDADLQHPPELLPELVAKWEEGYDMVVPCNHNRAGQSWLLRLLSRSFYKIITQISSVKLPPSASDFRLMDRTVVNAIKALPERSRFMKGIYAWAGFKTYLMEYQTKPRLYGSPKWNFWSRWNFALDGIFAYSSLPLRIWMYIGVFVALFSLAWAFWIAISAVLYGVNVVVGITTTTILVLFMNGLLMISIGIIGEYVGRIFEEVKQRPIYIVKNRVGKGLGTKE